MHDELALRHCDRCGESRENVPYQHLQEIHHEGRTEAVCIDCMTHAERAAVIEHLPWRTPRTRTLSGPFRRFEEWMRRVEERGGWRWYLLLLLMMVSFPLWFAVYVIAAFAVAFAGAAVVAAVVYLGVVIGLWKL